MDERTRTDESRSTPDSPPSTEPQPETGPVAAAEGPATETAAGEVEALRRQLEEKQDRLLRALAEMDNMRRRVAREREDYVRYATEALLRDLIPVLDNLDRALEAARSTSDAGKVVEGVELIRRELLRVLERAGLTRYSAVGQPFDPARHEATARVVSPDREPQTVVAEVVPGYLLHDRVLRPAQVAVAVAPDEDAA
ncbi:MAG TPA: nucleotide exchange factor GrpE [Candidatus Binatia bacterium]|nr:nucleotide exchange factor GrpE [Candidatus Binatia bacterium]